MPFVSAAELISQLLLGLCFGFSRGPLQLCRPAHRFESFHHPTTVISHLKHSRPLIDHRCQHSRHHQLQHPPKQWGQEGKNGYFFTCFAGLGPQCSAGPKCCQAGAGGLSWLSSEQHQEESLHITSTVQQQKAAASRCFLLPLIFLGTQTSLLLIKTNKQIKTRE